MPSVLDSVPLLVLVIFVVTGVAAGISGPAFIIRLLLAGIIATFNALSSAQLAAKYPHSGGTY